MISQVKSKNDICNQEMYGYGSFLVLITRFIEYVLKVTIKIIFHHSKTDCKIYKLSILMVVKGGGDLTKSYVLLFIGQEKSEFRQDKVRKFYRQSCVGSLLVKVYREHPKGDSNESI